MSFRDDEARANLAAISTPRLAHRFEKAFYDSFRTAERRTLAVVCFALGTWVGGMYTDCCRHLDARGYPLTVVTPGNHVSVILRVVLRHLLRLNSEFAHYVPPKCQRPRVELASLGDPAYFAVGTRR